MKYSVTNPMMRPAHNPEPTQKKMCLQKKFRDKPACRGREIVRCGYIMQTNVRGCGPNQFLTILGSCPTTLMVKVSGNAYHDTKKMAPVINTVEMISCLFNVGSISLTPLMVKMSVANKVVSRHTRIPAALMSSGKHMATKFLSVPKEDSDEITKAAQVDSAKDPNKSAPIPAMSPTLSPTLSAITCNTHIRFVKPQPSQ